ncbi:MAG: NAD(P)H-dependent glycerol-3-phosphate dehydrogenase [Pelotomaculum sp.]|uniref:Glycerol-3-phosphate dehydrogenase [NAD(P)+] n=1 Tax=Pelotomaculum thermopropionicum (strain DSM 13744 / JCM 10971 / SI) TaxID=370438 RepID=GPDA_PELTS|nr:RecName: Full=Glycerol-3-phosphate dehydrogenase [NAD(P)+]; AltName: Full=NAD(P)H-dependent glycerol-3-phosphate dehydrogenase [Pelotomaculum thermopropionicum SI]NPV74392.1 NAD(P)H-dependent glycerol-3-phosphate dehydrogenase [Pelotomaculum sp.]BAF59788.1 glycerol-3-phosphate dehydrogenase [Pelotomaculum thermopropionicum SI]
MSGKVAVLGAGSWATALSRLLSKKGCQVVMWSASSEQAREINETRENRHYLPGVMLPADIEVTLDLEKALYKAKAVVYGVPSHAFREVARRSLPYLPENAVLVNVAKGIEEESLYRMSQVFAEEAGLSMLDRYVVLSGPSHAEEVGRDIPTAVVVASPNMERAEQVQDLFMCESFRVYTNPDVVGVELGGALKNIIALGTGIADGLGFGDNTKAALMTRGLAEISRLGMVMGANPLTFAGLSGVGDLIVTCTSMHSRNRRAGMAIGQGKSLEEALSMVKMVVEGVRTTRAARRLSEKHAVQMPITEQIHRVLFEGLSPAVAVNKLMTRGKTHEMEEVALAAAMVGKIKL